MYVIVRENDAKTTLTMCYLKAAPTLEDATAMLRTYQIEYPLTSADARIMELHELDLKAQLEGSLRITEVPHAVE